MKKIIFVFIFLSFAACASKKTPPPLPVTFHYFPSKPAPKFTPTVQLGDPEQEFKKALNAYKAGNYEAALSGAWHTAEQYPGTPWYQRSLFLTEQALIQLDRPDEADAAMLQVKSEYREMADYAVFILADFHYSKGRFSQAAALYQQLTELYPKSSLAQKATFRTAQALINSYAYAQAADVLEKFLRANPQSEFAADAALALGRSLVAEARLHEAVSVYREAWIKYPGIKDVEVVNALTELSTSGVEISAWTADELYDRGKNLFRTAQYDKALEMFRKTLDIEPKCPNRADALFRIGMCQYNLGKRLDAVALLEKFLKDYPHDQRVPETMYWIGRGYSKLGEPEKSISTFQKILVNYKESDWADDALFMIGNIYREANDMKRAVVFYGRLAADYPQSKFADSAIWWNAWAHYKAGEYVKAGQKLQELISRYPRSPLVNQSLYWQGRMAEKAANLVKATEYYNKVLKHGRYTYYGYRAAERVAELHVQPQAAGPAVAQDPVPTCTDGACAEDPLYSYDTDEGPPVWTQETRQLLTAEPSFKKTLELMHLDMRKEAAAELWHLQEKLPRKRGALIGLSKAFFELGDYYRSLILVLRNYERYLDGHAQETTPDLWLLAYPQGYWDSILTYSRKYAQDPYFVAAIIREESQFHAEALSPAGARGIMQVMPTTGEWVAQNIRLQGFQSVQLFDSDTAINIGTWYIGHLMKRLKNDPLLVAAAYNAGPDAVAGWTGKTGPRMDRDEFVESIPFAETRGYVKKVLRNYAEYKRIYGKNSQNADHFLPADEAPIKPLVLDDSVTGPKSQAPEISSP